jgi:predicted AAA+ superfamily ATPase
LLAEVKRPSVDGYFSILVDTMIGYWLPAWSLNSSTKQVTWILHELRSYLSYKEPYFQPFFWRNHNGTEVDIVFEGKKYFYALEIKANKTWKSEFNKGLNSFKERFYRQLRQSKPLKLIGIYTGDRKAKISDKDIYPVNEFLKILWASDI